MKKIFFEDHGQDFLWWQIDETGLVVDCGPCQGNIWIGCTVVDPDNMQVGEKIDVIIKSPANMRCIDIREMNYKIQKIADGNIDECFKRYFGHIIPNINKI